MAGRLYDAVTRLPIAGAGISVAETKMRAVSDSLGFFHFQLPAGIYVLRVRHLGYFFTEIGIRAPQSQTIEIALQPQTLLIPGVIIESTRLKIDSLSTNFLLTPRSLANAPALGEADAFRALTLLPGVVIANDLKGELHVRGGGADENLIILDGVEIQNPFHLLGLFGAFNVEALKEAQFYPGATPAPYGDRLSSALVLRSKTADQIERSKANISLLASSVLLKRQWRNGDVMMALRRTYIDAVARVLGKKLGYHFYDGNFHLTQELSPAWQMAAVGFFNTDRVNPEETEGEASDRSNAEANFGWGNRAVGLRLTRHGNKAVWQNQIAYARNYVRAAGADNDVQIDNALNELSGQSHLEWQSNGRNLSVGIFLKRWAFAHAWQGDEDLEEIFYEDIPLTFRNAQRQFVLGGFGESGQRINSFLTLRGGARVSATTFRQARVLPRLSAHLQMPWHTRLRVSYGENAQWLAYGREGIEGAIGSPPFPLRRSLRSKIWAAAVEKNLPGAMALSTEIYRKKFSRLARLGEGDYPAFESGSGVARGLDIFIWRDRGRLTFQAGYSWLEAVQTFGEETYPTGWDIRHSFKGLLGWHLNQSWSLHVVTQAQSGAPFTPVAGYAPILRDLGQGLQLDWAPALGQRHSARLPRYMRADLSLHKRWVRNDRKTELYFQALNLLFRRNVLRYEPQIQSAPGLNGATQRYLNLKATTGLPLLPSFGISFEF